MLELVHGGRSTFQVLVDSQEEVRVRAGNKLLATVALRFSTRRGVLGQGVLVVEVVVVVVVVLVGVVVV